MSTSSKPRGRGTLKAVAEADAWRLPATVSRAPLLDEGSDKCFRQLVSDLFTIAARMETVREHLAQRMGLSASQYSVLMTVARLQGRNGVAVGAVAKQLHVSSAFIATETGKLAQAGLVDKRQNQKDRRGVLMSLTRAGRLLIERHSGDIRAINDAFFGALSQRAFAGMAQAAASLVHSSEHAVRRLQLMSDSTATFRDAAE
jgi:DNA-binding MarR family transcriptional regulator